MLATHFAKPRPSRLLAAAPLVLALLPGCGATRLDESAWRGRVDTISANVSEKTPGDSGREHAPLTPSDVSAMTGPLTINNEVRYSLTRGRGAESRDRWNLTIHGPRMAQSVQQGTIKVTSTSKGASPDKMQLIARMYKGELTVTEVDGDAQETPSDDQADAESTEALLGLAFLDGALFHAAASLSAYDIQDLKENGAPDGVRETYLRGLGSLLSMAYVANNNKTVRSLLREVVQWPSWWTLLSFSVSVSIDADWFSAVQVETPYGPGWRFPLELSVNGDPAFYATVTVVEPAGALLLVAGIVEIAGFAPHRPDDTVVLKLQGLDQQHRPKSYDKLSAEEQGQLEDLLTIKPELREKHLSLDD